MALNLDSLKITSNRESLFSRFWWNKTVDRLKSLVNNEIEDAINSIPSGSLPYTSYVGLVSASGGSATVIELENTTGLTFTWTIAGSVFTLTPSSSFVNKDKIFPNCGGSELDGSARTLRYDYPGSSTAALSFRANSTVSKAPFEIRIYP